MTAQRHGPRAVFHKSIGTFDRIELKAMGVPGNDWLNIVMHVGHDVHEVQMTLRSDEAVHDLHYALGRYLEHIKGKE